MQGTLLPSPWFVALDDQGRPLPGAKLTFFESGTSTPATVYTDAALTTPHPNPVVCDGAGRCVVFLAPGSYRLQIANAGGSLIREVDPVTATAPYNVNLDVLGVAGEALAAGDVVYLSGGDGGTTPGRWYRTTATVEQKSSLAAMVGMAPRAIASGQVGTIRLSGKITGLSGLSAGTPYYVSTVAGGLTSTPPTYARLVGVADSGSTLVLFGGNGGGITITSGLSFVPLEAYGSDKAAIIATINASTEGGGTLRIAANKVQISGQTVFASGYDPTGKVSAGGAAADVNAHSTTIDGSKIRSGTLESNNWGASAGSQFDLINGTFRLGGSAAPKLSWDGSTLAVSGAITGSAISGSTISGGTIDGSVITGGTVRTAASGARVVLDTAPSLKWYDSSNVLLGSITTSGVVLGATTGRHVVISDTEVQIKDGTNIILSAQNTYGGSVTVPGWRFALSDLSLRPHASGARTVELSNGVANPVTIVVGSGAGVASWYAHRVSPGSDNGTILGAADKRWMNIHLNLPAHTTTTPTYVVVNNPTDQTSLGYITGYTGTVVIAGTTLTFKCGILTGVS